jgi:predicted esterase
LKLDFYEGTGDTETNRPLIIWVHGGSFLGGTKTDMDVQALSRSFAQKGYACASIDYRTGFFPIDSANAVKAVVRAVQDLKGAIRFFYKDVATGTNTYNIDTNRIYIGGSSAGAITALHVAYLDEVCEISGYLNQTVINQLGGLEGASGNPGYSSKIQGVINLCGALARYSWLESGDVPFVSIHGTADGTVKYNRGIVNPGTPLMYLDGSRLLFDRACAVNVQNNFYTFPGAPHVPYAGASANAIAYMDTTDNFIRDFLIDQLGCTNSPLQLANSPLQAAILYPTNYCDGSPVNETCIVGINEESLSFSVELFPNPSEGVVHLRTQEFNFSQVAVLDLLGRTVLKIQPNNQEVILELSHLSPGNYLVTYLLNNGSYGTKQLVIR